MIEEDSVTVHLLSNARPTSPEQIQNTIGNFITRLPRRLNFSEDWEVALTSISYTKSWYNIHDDQNLRLVQVSTEVSTQDSTQNSTEPSTKRSTLVHNIDEQLPAGNYEVEDLLIILNQIFERFVFNQTVIITPPILTYNQQSNKVIIQLGLTNSNDFIYPNFDNFLANLLGLTDSQNRQFPNVENYKTFVHKERIIQRENNDIYKIDSNMTNANNQPNINESAKNAPNSTIVLESPSLQDNQSQVTQTSQQPKERSSRTNENTGKINSVRKQNPPNSRKTQKLPPQFTSTTHTTLEERRGVEGIENENLTRVERSLNQFEEKTFVQGFGEVTLFGTIKSLFVYCNIIKPNIVSDTEVPLIRRVEIPSDKKFGQTVEINYSLPEYYPLVTHEFQSIEIDIKDDTNKRIEFAFGRVSIALRFRKRNDGLKSLQKLLF